MNLFSVTLATKHVFPTQPSPITITFLWLDSLMARYAASSLGPSRLSDLCPRAEKSTGSETPPLQFFVYYLLSMRVNLAPLQKEGVASYAVSVNPYTHSVNYQLQR